MLGLPKSTEVNKQLPKKAIYQKFQMNTAAKEEIDKDISRITIVNEISSSKLNVSEGESVKSFFCILVALKNKEFDDKNIITISKLIPQNMVMILKHENQAKLAIYRNNLFQTEWDDIDTYKLNIEGLNLDKVWENIVVQIGELQVENGNTLDEQIAIDEKKSKIIKNIAKLEKKAKSEKQPRKKYNLFNQIKKLKRELEKI